MLLIARKSTETEKVSKMRLHPRYFIVQKASSELTGFMLDLIEKHELTHGEIAKLLAEEILTWTKYEIRAERHPEDPEKKGDEA